MSDRHVDAVTLTFVSTGIVINLQVGYKMRFFGEDAETAAQVCHIWAFHDHAMLTASFPVYRLALYVRRLCAAGHRVGVVRQVRSRLEAAEVGQAHD